MSKVYCRIGMERIHWEIYKYIYIVFLCSYISEMVSIIDSHVLLYHVKLLSKNRIQRIKHNLLRCVGLFETLNSRGVTNAN